MLKTALLLFGVAIAVLAVLALLPEGENDLPDQRIELSSSSVALYPQADPEAVWRFSAPSAHYEPESGSSTLYRIEQGRREVAGETDFTVAAQQLTIDRRDDIMGDLIFAFLVETGECLTMRGTAEKPVVIDQRAGRFDVPVLEITGPSWGENTRLEKVRVSFDLEDFEGGGPGTTTTAEFRVGGDDEARRRTVCEDS